MPRPLNAEEKKLLELAKAQQSQIQDAAVANAWNVIVEAVEKAWLGMSGAHSLRNTITELSGELSGGGRVAVEEYSIEVSRDNPKELIVSLMADQFYAPRAELLLELRRLLARHRGEPEPEAAKPAAALDAAIAAEPEPEPAPEPTPEKLAPILTFKLAPRSPAAEAGSAAAAPGGNDDDKAGEQADEAADGGTFATQLGRMIDSFADRVRTGADKGPKDASAPQRLGLLDSIRAELDKARVAQAAKEPSPAANPAANPAAEDAKAALDKVVDKVRAIDRDQLAEAIHHVADCVKSPEGGAAAFESFLSKLQTNLNAAFDKSAKPTGASPFKGVREAMEKRIAEAKDKAQREQAERERAERAKNQPPDDN